MCIICYKPSGKKVNLTRLASCFMSNPHGAGIMYVKDNKVNIVKGLMSFKEFRSALRALSVSLGGLKNIPMVFHFRISTQAGVQPGMTHPYPVCDNYDTMKKLCIRCDMGMAHNGIIQSCSTVGETRFNDSMKYNHDYVYPTIHDDYNFFNDDSKMEFLKRMSENTRVIFMTKNGDVITLGRWIEYDGCLYSHHSYFMTGV